MEVKNKYVLITGASSGIGREIAILLSETKNIVLSGRNIEALNITKENCSKNNKYLLFQCDLSKTENLENNFSTFIKENDIEIFQFVHCAGFMKMLPLKMVTLDYINTAFSTNIISASLIVKVLINRRLNKSALKNVVFISSNISNFGAKAFNIYSATKSALDGLMRSLAVELSPKVRINSVLPGAIETEMTQSVFQNEETVERMEALYPLGLGDKVDIFNMVEFLLSDKSRWITGQQFTVDGGRTINISG
tara:strand:+ start:12388 stop:13140 length:753 start_codon:yes stop_codon:yes gene_type:complete